MKKLAVALIALAFPTLAQQRIASDFEIAEMKKQLARSRSFASQIAGHLNLGDVYLARNERTTAVSEYRVALHLASTERTQSRRPRGRCC